MNKYTGLIAAPNTWLLLSLFTILYCCGILGIVALIFSILTERANSRGDYSKACRYSRLAAWFNITAIVLGLLCILTFVIFFFTLDNAAYHIGVVTANSLS